MYRIGRFVSFLFLLAVRGEVVLLAGCVLCYDTGLAAAFVKGFGSWVLGVLGRLWG